MRQQLPILKVLKHLRKSSIGQLWMRNICQNKYLMSIKWVCSGSVCWCIHILTGQDNARIQSIQISWNVVLGWKCCRVQIKAFLIYQLGNSRAFENVNKHSFPVYYCHHKKAWMTSALFKDRGLKCFILQAREYCRQSNISFKIALILDNAPGPP